MPDSCPRRGRLIGGCRFEARYHTIEPHSHLPGIISAQRAVSEADKQRLIIRRTYVHDVCVRCGETRRVVDNGGGA